MLTPLDERKNLRKDAVTLFSGGIGASVFASIEVVVLARFLGLEQFGLFTLVISYVKVVNSLLDMKIGEAVVKYITESKEKGKLKTVSSFVKFFYIVDLSSGVISFAVCILLAGVANDLFIKSDDAFSYVLIFSISLLVSTVNQSSHAILQSFKKFRHSAFFKVFNNFIKLILILTAFIIQLGIEGFFAAYVVAELVSFLLLQVFVNRVLVQEGMSNWLFADLQEIKSQIREVLWFMMNTAISGFMSFASSSYFPILILGHFSGAEASSLYKIARSIMKVVEKIRNPIYSVVYPALTRISARESYKEFRQLIVHSVKEIVKFIIPVSVLVLIFAEQLIELAFGSEYLPAVGTMRILIVTVMIYAFLYWTWPALLSLGMFGVKSMVVLITMVLYLSALLILVPRYSHLGAALASFAPLIFNFVVAIFLFLHIKRREQRSRIS